MPAINPREGINQLVHRRRTRREAQSSRRAENGSRRSPAWESPNRELDADTREIHGVAAAASREESRGTARTEEEEEVATGRRAVGSRSTLVCNALHRYYRYYPYYTYYEYYTDVRATSREQRPGEERLLLLLSPSPLSPPFVL